MNHAPLPLAQRPRRFLRAEDGASTIPAVLFLPVLFMLLFSSVELGLLSLRQELLGRGLDQTVRLLRVAADTLPADNNEALVALKKSVCGNIGFIQNCMEDLTIELFAVTRNDVITVSATGVATVTRDWFSSGRGTRPSCTDRNLTPPPVVTLDRSVNGQLTLVRACLKIDPIMPFYGIGGMLHKDANDMVALIASTAYVREPVAPGN